MSGDAMAVLNQGAATVAGQLGRACWQGGLAIAAVWGLCHLGARWPPGLRCWLWRLAYLKLLAALVWSTPVALPLLSPFPAAKSDAPPALRHLPDQQMVVPRGASISRFPQDARSEGRGRVASVTRPRERLPGAAAGLLLFWLAGAGWHAARTAREWRASRRLIRDGTPIEAAGLSERCTDLCRRLGVHRAPRLLVSKAAGSPMLVGAWRPVVLFPPALLAACSQTELELLLAHELAHLHRRDLAWAWFPTAAGWLFFFHPLVWLAGREWRLAQEVACDERAVRMTGAPAWEYGEMVLRVAAQSRVHRFGDAAVASAAGACQSLRRRLIAIQQIRSAPARPGRWIGVLLATLAVAMGVPWQITARAATDEPRLANQARGQLGASENDRRQTVLTHQRHLEEQEHLRRLEIRAHERRHAELEYQRRRAVLDHQHRLAEQEQTLRAQAGAHRQREAVAEQERRMARLAHEQRLAEQEHARSAVDAQGRLLAERTRAQRLDQTLQLQRAQTRVSQQQLAVQQQAVQREAEAIRRMIYSLSQQLRKLQIKQQSLAAQRERWEAMLRQQREMEHAVQRQLERSLAQPAPPRREEGKGSP